jgi:hypothetical protein
MSWNLKLKCCKLVDILRYDIVITNKLFKCTIAAIQKWTFFFNSLIFTLNHRRPKMSKFDTSDKKFIETIFFKCHITLRCRQLGLLQSWKKIGRWLLCKEGLARKQAWEANANRCWKGFFTKVYFHFNNVLITSQSHFYYYNFLLLK